MLHDFPDDVVSFYSAICTRSVINSKVPGSHLFEVFVNKLWSCGM
jgi:hypothetical protein